MKEELFKDIIEGDNVTKLKNEVCDALKKMDNEEFLDYYEEKISIYIVFCFFRFMFIFFLFGFSGCNS